MIINKMEEGGESASKIINDSKNQFKIQYKQCQNGGLHEGETLNYICIDPNSKLKGLLCSVCRNEIYKDMKVKPLKMFIKELEQKLQSSKDQKSENGSNLEQLLSEVDETHLRILSSLKQAVTIMAEKIKELQLSASSFVKHTREKIISQVQMSVNTTNIIKNIIQGSHLSNDELKEDIKQIIDILILKGTNIDQFEVDINPDQVLSSYKVIQKSFLKEITGVSQMFLGRFNKINKSFDSINNLNSGQRQIVNFSFSTTLQSSTIALSLENQYATQTAAQSDQNRYLLLTPGLSLSEKTLWAIQIKNISSWIGIGVALKKKLQMKKFGFSSGAIGHGTYMISHNSYTWSDHNTAENAQTSGFNYSLNDIVIIEFDPEAQSLSFWKHNNNVKKTLMLQIPPNQEVCAYVNLGGKNDSVQIVPADPYIEELNK